MNRNRRSRTIICGALLFSLSTVVAQLEPVGPPEDTRTWMKTMNEIEPRALISSVPWTITNSGSYYLTRNLTAGTNAANGIIIAVSDVTLDMGGFILTGTTNGAYGISISGGNNRNITIKNGVVRGWGTAGLYLPNGMNCRLTDVTVVSNGTLPTFASVYVGQEWDVDDCSSSYNRGMGFSIGSSSRARNCKARGNKNDGFLIGNGGRVENCVATENSNNGFSGGMMSIIQGCTANNNTNHGIYVGLYSMASGNISSYNNADGIRAGTGSLVRNNVSAQNKGNGIYAEAYSRITENQVVLNLGTGIFGSEGCRVDNNHVYGGPVGIRSASSSAGSLYIANSVSGCTTNFRTSSSANFGQILNSTLLGISTNFNIPNPWANFSL